MHYKIRLVGAGLGKRGVPGARRQELMRKVRERASAFSRVANGAWQTTSLAGQMVGLPIAYGLACALPKRAHKVAMMICYINKHNAV